MLIFTKYPDQNFNVYTLDFINSPLIVCHPADRSEFPCSHLIFSEFTCLHQPCPLSSSVVSPVRNTNREQRYNHVWQLTTIYRTGGCTYTGSGFNRDVHNLVFSVLSIFNLQINIVLISYHDKNWSGKFLKKFSPLKIQIWIWKRDR